MTAAVVRAKALLTDALEPARVDAQAPFAAEARPREAEAAALAVGGVVDGALAPAEASLCGNLNSLFSLLKCYLR